MKLRIQDNSLRLRLTKPEVDSIISGKSVAASTLFGESAFVYQLIPSNESGLSAKFKNGEISVFINEDLAKTWVDETKVGFEDTLIINEQKLHLLIEKDFKCLSPAREGKENEMFENPSTKC